MRKVKEVKTKKTVTKQSNRTKSTVAKKKKSPEAAKKKTGLVVDVYNIQGKAVGKQNLPKDIFGVKVNKNLLTQAVRVYLFNQRKGVVSTKSRGEVRGGGIKPRRQKGTGRARVGSIRAPHWRGGGIIFGPKPRDFRLKFLKKMTKAALFSALSDKAQNGRILVIDGLEKIDPKTKSMAKILDNFKDRKLGKTLLILPEKVENLERASRNLRGINLEKVGVLNTYEVLTHQTLLFLKNTTLKIEEVFGKKTVAGK